MSPTSGVEHPGTFAGVIEKIPYLQELGRHRRRAAAGLRVRRARGARDQPARRLGAAELLGLRPVPPLRAAGELLHQPRRGLADHRVPRHGEGAAQGRDRGDPRRRLQPHRRGQPHGPDDQLQGPRQRRLLPAAPDPARSTTWTTRAAGTRSTRTIRSCRSSSSTACTTGSRRCTSTASASTRARCCTAAATARRWSSRRSSGASSCPRSSPTRR